MGIFAGLGTGNAESASRDHIEADVLAELHHHLDAAAAELVADGREPEDAAREARRRFGSLEPIRRRCLRQQLGGRAMLHKIHLAFTCLLTVAVVGFAVQSITMYRRSLTAEEAARARAAELDIALSALQARETAPIERSDRVQVGDMLEIVDLYNPEVNATKRVAVDGMVLVPSRWVHVAGLTRAEVEARLTEELGPFFVQTSITVEILPRREAAPLSEFAGTIFSGF